MINDQLFDKRNTKNNAPVVKHVELGAGHTLGFINRN
jgi:hypothetical protein